MKTSNKLKSIRAQAMTEYVLLSLAIIVGLGIFSVLDDDFVAIYNKILEDAFFMIRMPL